MAEPHSFEDVAAGALAGRNFTLVVCSFALHLLDESWLPALATQLALVSDALLILTPHKVRLSPAIRGRRHAMQTRHRQSSRAKPRSPCPTEAAHKARVGLAARRGADGERRAGAGAGPALPKRDEGLTTTMGAQTRTATSLS